MVEFVKTGRALMYCYNHFSVELGSLLHPKPFNTIHIRTYAARKGYREKAKKKKVKTVIVKQAWIPHNLRKKDVEEKSGPKRSLEQTKPVATDDVWISKKYAWKVYDFKEAVECHRETHHPTVYNVPDAHVNVYIELDMSTAKPTRFVEKFKKMAMLPNFFEQDGLLERTVLAFCKTDEQKEAAQNAGANLVGGVEIIKEIEFERDQLTLLNKTIPVNSPNPCNPSGPIEILKPSQPIRSLDCPKGKIVLPDFRFIIAHPTILPEMITLRGLLKKKFPNVKSGTLGPNIGELVAQFKNGVEYTCFRDDKELDYGWIDTTIGRLQMDTGKLEENFIALLNDVNQQRPKRSGPFITRVLMTSAPSVERLKLDLQPYLKEEEPDDGESSDEDEAVPAKV